MKFAKVMFSQVSVCPQGVSVSVQGGLSPGGGLCPLVSRGISVQVVSVQGVSVQGDLCPGGSVQGVSVCTTHSLPYGGVSETPHKVMSVWYTSYWNAFLFV